MEIFLAQKVSGEDKEKLREDSRETCSILNENGHNAYCTFLEDSSFDKLSKGEKISHAFKKIDDSDTIIGIVKSDEKSEGMLLEIGYGISKGKKFILLIQEENSSGYLEALANEKIEFNSSDELKEKLKEI